MNQWIYSSEQTLDCRFSTGMMFVQKRPVYCDRGHFSLDIQGVRFHRDPLTQRALEPSRYFHDLDVATSEGQLWAQWLVGGLQISLDEESLPPSERMTWNHTSKQGLVCFQGTLRGQDEAHVTVKEHIVDDTRIWTMNVFGIPSLDDADAFPRHFLRLEHAALEAESFLKWRLLKQPTVSRDLPELNKNPVFVEAISEPGVRSPKMG